MGRAFRVVSANLWHGRADAAAFARLVAALGADAVAVQELGPAQADALARVLPWGLLAPARDYSGMGIALRHPGAVRRIPLPCRDAHVAEVAATPGEDGDGLEVVNVHLMAPHVRPLWRTLRTRRRQVRSLVDYLEGTAGRRRVLVGDLNATPLWPAYRRLAARLSDAALEVARRQGTRPRPTWGPGPRARRLLRIDHVLVSGVAVRDVHVVPIPGGDHHALVADLLVPAAR
jgi:endonuclease/exonuclease/phosphatase (EEP) superfamily protein YafD